MRQQLSNAAEKVAINANIVMVRDYADMPHQVPARAFDGRTVTVGDDRSHLIGYRKGDVYVFDSKLLTKIGSAKSREQRQRLWGQASPYVPNSLPPIPAE